MRLQPGDHVFELLPNVDWAKGDAVRAIRADIPVRRPHKMSFTTLEAVNFVFVRLETRGRDLAGNVSARMASTISERPE